MRGRILPACTSAAVVVVALAAVANDVVGHCFAAPWRSKGVRAKVARPAMAWQEQLDRALLSVDVDPMDRLTSLRSVLQNSSAVVQDVQRAVSVLAERGFRDGHPEAIETLWPKGTVARADLDGLQALRKQLPEVVQELQSVGPQSSFRRADSRSNVNVGNLASGLLELVSDRKKQEEFIEEAKNVLRPTPRGLETPSYSVVRTFPVDESRSDVVELRRYKPFTVAKRAMVPGNATAFSAEGFTTLAGYLFGKNSEKTAMEMTMPVEINYDGQDKAVMSFVLPQEFADAPPRPDDEDGIELSEIPERLVVVKTFPGVVTQGEVERQRELLAKALEADGAGLRQVNASEYSILQYNPPYTLPWRRRNELAEVVVETQEQDQEAAGTMGDERAGEAPGEPPVAEAGVPSAPAVSAAVLVEAPASNRTASGSNLE